MEILKNVILALHVIGVAGLLGGVIYQAGAMRSGSARIIPAMIHSAWTMLISGILLVGLQYPLGNEVNNAKISVKLVVLIAIIVLVLINRRREAIAAWALPAIGGLTVLNIVLATVWR